MTDHYEITDAERGLESAPKKERSAPVVTYADVIEKEKHWLSQAEKRIEQIESVNAKPGWKLTQAVIDDLYFSFEGTDPANYTIFDLSVGAIVTWELIEKDMNQGINYSWSRQDYVLGDLVQPHTPKERRTPVKTIKTIRWRNKEIVKEVKSELENMAEQQLRGDDEEKSKEKIARLRRELHENNDTLIERAETDEEFEEAMSNIETGQSLGDEDEGEQVGELAQQYDKKRDWIREAAEKRPDSVVNKVRHLRNVGTEQMLGVDEELHEVDNGGLSSDDKAIIRDNARKYAQKNAPPGSSLVSLDVQFVDLRQGRYTAHAAALIDVEVTANYDGGIDDRGLPVTATKSWTFNPNELLRYSRPERRPIEKVPYQY